MSAPATTPSRPTTARWELIRSLGAFVMTPPPGNAHVSEALGLEVPTPAEHTAVFVLGAPPHAAIHLGPEGQLGGEGQDRVSGFWRALGLRAPEDADHLGALLMMYAELGHAEHDAGAPRSAAQLHRSRRALLHEHLWSWAPGYLEVVSTLGSSSVREWAQLVRQVLVEEVASGADHDQLPLALRAAPSGISFDDGPNEVLDAAVAPVRSGFLLTQRDVQMGARRADLGFRRGERRYALRAMLDQDPRATLRWLQEHATSWAEIHRRQDDPTSRWWTQRAESSAAALGTMAASQ